MEKTIHFKWSGPFSLKNLKILNNTTNDYGIYHIYGTHVIYGQNVLLYIGKAQEQTFFTRINQEDWQDDQDPMKIEIYTGRIIGKNTTDDKEWGKQIDLCEKLLIYSHAPAYNAHNINSIPEQKLENIRIFNWGAYKNLLPEISGKRWTSKFQKIHEAPLFSYDNKHT